MLETCPTKNGMFHCKKFLSFLKNLIFLLKLKKIRDNREKFSKLRTIYVSSSRPENYVGEEPLNYRDNTISTSKVNTSALILYSILFNLNTIYYFKVHDLEFFA